MSKNIFRLVLLFLSFLLAAPPDAAAQAILQKTITVSAPNQELRTVLEQLEAQTGVKFVYSSDFIGIDRKVSIQLSGQPLAAFLQQVLPPLGIGYRVIDEHQVLLFRQAGAAAPPPPAAGPAPRPEKRVVVLEVKNHFGQLLPGVSVVEAGTGKGTLTDEAGRARITVAPAAVLRFSLAGYQGREVKVGNSTSILLTMAEEIRTYDEVIVTGVFDKSRRMESSIAVSTLNEAEFAKLAPASAADILRHVPGVFVNSSLGEIRNIVYSRGVSAHSTEASFGYYYVSFQEDGLPVTNVTFGNFGPDYYCRPDASFKRLEAVRAGTSSILGPNAPGGIFNYISKTGGERFAGLAKAKYGIEGDGNGYYRADVNIGGPAGKKRWYYNAGGFYRYSQGARYAGYPLNEGGQFRGNLEKKYDRGYLKLSVKYLNDRNGWFEFLPARNFERPKLAPGVKQTDTYLLEPAVTSYPFLSTDSFRSFDPTTLAHCREAAIGLQGQYSLGGGWKLSNNFRFSAKKQNWQSSALVYPLPVDSPNLYNLLGTLGRKGIYTFRDRSTGQVLARAQTTNGATYSMLETALPGEGVMKGGVLTQLGYTTLPQVQEFMDQLMVSKKVGRMTFTAGSFMAHSRVKSSNTLPVIGVGTVQHRPRLLDLTLTDSSGRVLQVTNADGYTHLGGLLEFHLLEAVQYDRAVFFEHSWQLGRKVKADWACRYEHIRVKGSNVVGVPNPGYTDPSFGGLDGNAATLYDNQYFVRGNTFAYDKSLGTFSYSVGASYKMSDDMAVYGRFAHGQKSPDLTYYFSYDNAFKLENDRPRAQQTTQAEIGFTARGKNSRVWIIPFYSLLSNVLFNLASFPDSAGRLYYPPPQYNSIRSLGVECEAEYRFLRTLQVRATVTVQTAKSLSWKNWVAHGPGRWDDELQDFSGNRADNNPGLMLNLTPAYNGDRLYGFFSWKYMGSRPGNIAQAIMLPGFSQFDLGTGWNLNRQCTLSLNINNLLNSEGVMSWAPPGGYPGATDRQGFTREKRNANPDAPFGVICIQPRAYFLTFSCTF
ncbi:TonB-dependent receptor [Paraflavisolibacter sp. H34]|uniref:TonB-dependent receptor domain-containing protein n=1 Tax=Huijunlia imazamoxiresistens TaxID=3127457 RepID=UPI0030197B18